MLKVPLLVGEVNPLGPRPELALYPHPVNSTGWRLCNILGLSRREYMRRFERVNLCVGDWSLRRARQVAEELWPQARTRPFILLGRRVCQAFRLEYRPFGMVGFRVYVLPHPSGRCRTWNEPAAVPMARTFLEDFLQPQPREEVLP